MSGTVQANNLGGTAKLHSPAATQSQSKKTSVTLVGIFAEPKTELDHLAVDLSWKMLKSADSSEEQIISGFRVEIHQFDMANGDAEGAVTGTYEKTPGQKGTANLGGWLKQAKASRVSKYLPLKLPSKIRDWMRTAKTIGVSNDVKWVLNGNLDRFPFRKPNHGEFLIDATVSQASLTYAPSWPRASKAKVKLRFQRAGMQIDVIDGQLFDGVPISNARVWIEDYRDAILSLTGSTTGSALQAAKFGLATPLARNLSPALSKITVSGQSKIDVDLKIPLSDFKALEYQGKSRLTNVRLDLADGIPAVSNINGDIVFHNGAVQIDSLEGQILDNPFRLDARSSPKLPLKLEIEGQASANALRQLVDHPLTSALSGNTAYQAKV